MAAHVDHEAAVAEARRVVDRAAGDLGQTAVVADLQQALHGIEEAGRGAGQGRHTPRRDLQPVGFVRGETPVAGFEPQLQIGTLLAGRLPAERREVGRQVVGRRSLAARHADFKTDRRLQTVKALGPHIGSRSGNHPAHGGGLPGGRRRGEYHRQQGGDPCDTQRTDHQFTQISSTKRKPFLPRAPCHSGIGFTVCASTRR